MIKNAADQPIFEKSGELPDVSGALESYYQPMTFTQVAKIVDGFQINEVATPWNFQGVIQPYTERKLLLLPEGQRAWSWYLLHAEPTLKLQVDEVVIWNGQQTRVMTRKDFYLYGYVEYTLVQDWTGSGPT